MDLRACSRVVLTAATRGAFESLVAWMDKNNPELARAYNELPGGPFAFHSGAIELWHYTGTIQSAEGILIHTFRHRNHPYTNRPMIHHIRAAQSWMPSPSEATTTFKGRDHYENN